MANSEIQNFALPEVFAQQDKYIAKNKKIMTGLNKIAKAYKEIDKSLNKAEKSQKTLDTVTQEGNKLLKQRDALVSKQDKNLEELTKQTIKLKEAEKKRLAVLKEEVTGEKKAAEIKKLRADAAKRATAETKKQTEGVKNLIKELQKEVKTENQANASNKKLIAARKGLSDATAKGRKQIELINKKIDRNNKLLTKNASGYGKLKRGIGEYERGQSKANVSLKSAGKSLLGFVGQLGLAVGAAALFKKGLDVAKASILSIQTTGDKFTNSLAGLKEGYNSFIRGIATGTSFKDLIQNFRDATKVGAEYSAILDDLGDLQRSLRISESEARLEQEKLLTTTRDVSKTDQERIKAIEEFIVIETELTNKRKINTEKAFAAELLIAKQRSGLNKNEILDFLENQETYINTVQERAQAIDKLEDQQKSIDLTTEEGRQQQIESLNDLLVEQTEEEKSIARIIENAAQLDDTMRDRLVNAYEALINVETNSLKASQRVFTMRGSLIKRLRDEAEATKGLTKVKTDNSDIIQAKTIENVGVVKTANQEIINDEEELARRLKAINDKIDKDDQDKADKKKERIAEIAILTLSSASTLADSFFDSAQNQRDQELASINALAAAQIAAAEGNAEAQKQIADRLKVDQDRIREEQFQADKNQALLKIAFNTAIGITSSLTSLPPNIPLSIAVGIIGAAQAAVVASKELPAFFKGTSDTPFEYTAGEKGSELMIKKDGSLELTPDKKTHYKGQEYEHAQIIPSLPTQQLLAGRAMGNNDRALLNEMKLTRKAIDNIDINVLFSKNVPKLNRSHFNRKHKKHV